MHVFHGGKLNIVQKAARLRRSVVWFAAFRHFPPALRLLRLFVFVCGAPIFVCGAPFSCLWRSVFLFPVRRFPFAAPNSFLLAALRCFHLRRCVFPRRTVLVFPVIRFPFAALRCLLAVLSFFI